MCECLSVAKVLHALYIYTIVLYIGTCVSYELGVHSGVYANNMPVSASMCIRT